MSAQLHEQERVVASSLAARTPLESALGAAHVGYYEWDPSAGEAFVSESLTELFGLSAPEAVASTAHWYDLIHRDDRSRYRSMVERSVAAGAGWHSEFRVVRPRDGTIAWVEERASVGSDDAARVRSVIGLVWDITERKRTEAALRDSEDRLRRIVEIDTIGVLFFNLDGRMTDANAAFARMTGYANDELLALDWRVLTPPEWMPATERAAAELSTAAETQPYVKELKRKDGSRFWALCGPRLLRGRGGDAVEFIVDITEAREARRALRVSEARFRTLVENILDYAIYAIDPRGVITDWTEGARRVMGYSADEALGSHISRFYLPEDLADGIVERQLREAAKTGRSELETWKVRPDGSRFWANEITNSVRDANGNLTGFTRISRDLTAQRQAQEEKAAQYERERRGREAAEAFLAVMSHELRTPVTSIHGSAALLARDPQRPDVADLVSDMQDEAERLMRIIDDLLVLSGVDRGLIQLAPEPVLLQHAISDVLADVRRRFPAVTLEAAVPASLPAVVADSTALRQVLYNLITNAAKYAGSAGPVRIEAADRGDTVEVAVLDEGPGLGSDPGTLFTLFYRSPDTAKHTSGTGIGLYVVRELLSAMGTTIDASTRDSGGAAFQFRLPAALDVEA